MRVVVRPAARQDILRQYAWYVEQDVPDVAERFLYAANEGFELLELFPEAGAGYRIGNPVLTGLRSWQVKGFEEIRIYYLVRADIVDIVRVLHGRREVGAILEELDSRNA